jgi:hypothetical protein
MMETEDKKELLRREKVVPSLVLGAPVEDRHHHALLYETNKENNKNYHENNI